MNPSEDTAMAQDRFFVFLSHGLESGPTSTKVQAMKAVAEEFDQVHVEALDHRSTRNPAAVSYTHLTLPTKRIV